MSTGAVLTVLALAPSLTGCDSPRFPVFAHSVYMHIAYTHTSLSLFFFFLPLPLCNADVQQTGAYDYIKTILLLY